MIKKDFIKYINELVSLKEDTDKLAKAFQLLDPDFNFFCLSRHENLIVSILEDAMEDKSEWISYWLYDCDCGKDSKGRVKNKGKVVPLKTPGDLYKCIKSL